VPGASGWLRGGLAAYQSEVKAKGLGIAPALIEATGPVSGEVAFEMARGARIAFDADVAVAVACAAGPEPEGAPVGAIFVALAGPGAHPIVRELHAPGDRAQVRQFATTFALNLLRMHLEGETLR
jgi:nicotinamide-nucleotide amidase